MSGGLYTIAVVCLQVLIYGSIWIALMALWLRFFGRRW